MKNKQLVTRINKEFIVRYKFNEDKRWSLIGAGRLWVVLAGEDKSKEAGEEEAEKFCNKALKSITPEVFIKLRRGLILNFRPR